MTTTALYVELIVIGVQVEAWIIILVNAFFRNNFSVFTLASDNAFIVLLALIPAYVLGMLFDRIADQIFYQKEQRIKKKSGLHSSSSLLIEETPKMHEFQLYTRSKYRVLRATTLNTPLLAFSIIANLLLNKMISYGGAILILALGIVVTFMFYWCSVKTVENFYNKAQLIEDHHEKSKQ